MSVWIDKMCSPARRYVVSDDPKANKKTLIDFCIHTRAMDADTVKEILGWFDGFDKKFVEGKMKEVRDREWFDREGNFATAEEVSDFYDELDILISIGARDKANELMKKFLGETEEVDESAIKVARRNNN